MLIEHKLLNTRDNKRKIYCWLSNGDDDEDGDEDDGDDSTQFNYSIVYQLAESTAV